MKDKLINLAARWNTVNCNGMKPHECAAELLAILDADGDGGAVGDTFAPISEVEARYAPTDELWNAYNVFNDHHCGFNTQQALRHAINSVLEHRSALAAQGQSAASLVGVPDGIAIIAAERKRQIDKEGWSPAHDVAEYEGGELASAAACYAMPPEYKLRECTPPLAWPWEESWWKPGDRLRELAKAGALIAAEIDRLAAAPSQPEE